MILRRIAAGALLLAAACSEAERTGELVVAIASDLAMPDQIDNVRVQVLVHGRAYLDTDYAVGRDDYRVPATITLAAGEDPSTPVQVRVMGRKQGQWRTVREATTTIPPNRSALLRMPIQWLCDGKVRTESVDGAGSTKVDVLAGCEDEGHTCIAGICRPKLVAETAWLPSFGAPQVFGGSSDPRRGSCFDTVRCMEQGRVYVPDAECTVEKPASDRLNFALRVTDDGICDATKTACFVPLDADSDEGWLAMPGSGRVQITPGACEALRDRRANALYASESCEPKFASLPPCGDWSSVGEGAGEPTDVPPIAIEKPREVINLLGGTSASLCCPLMADAGKLYTCVCERKSDATLVMVNPALETPVRENIGVINPTAARERMRFGASLYAGAVFWQADSDLIRRTPLPMSGATAGEWTVNGAVYENTSLLASSAGVFMLASGVSDARGAPVQMISLAADAVRSFDTGSTQPVFQFDQDDLALYLAVAIDEPDGSGTRRTARVVRMDKATGALTPVLEDRVLALEANPRGGGYTGVQVDGDRLYALFEDAPDANGVMNAEVQRVDLRTPGAPTVVYRTTLDRKVSQLSFMGVVDGAVLLTRIELAADGGAAAVRGASVIGIPPGGGVFVPSSQTELSGGARILADFPRDYPGLDLVSDDTHVYWLNTSGRLYSISRMALQ